MLVDRTNGLIMVGYMYKIKRIKYVKADWTGMCLLNGGLDIEKEYF